MPLVRLLVRNEFGLGQPELYKETNREDPKPVLDGVAVAGLVGILRQLGDLADFVAEVFHDLQEQVMTIASRSHKLMLRVQNIEASLPPLEKAVLTQTSHIHFAYTAGCEWHCQTKTVRNHFIYNDLPQFIMDSYEECQDPPRLHLLDKFDTGGPGSCLKRYSDPTFFKRVPAYSDEAYSEKIERARKTHRSKKKRSSRRNGEIQQGAQMHSNSGRLQFVSHVNGCTSSSQTASTIDMTVKSDLEDHSNSFDISPGAGYIECVFHPRNSVQPDEQESKESSSSRFMEKTDTLQLASPAIDDNFSLDSFDKQIASTSTGLTWDEKEEIVDSKSQPCDRDKTAEVLLEKQNLDMHEDEAVTSTNIDHNDIIFDEESNLKPVSSRVQTDEIDNEPHNYLDALNTIESESENDMDWKTKREVEQFASHVTCGIMENGVGGATSAVLDHDIYDVPQTVSDASLKEETGRDFRDSLQEIPPLISEPHVTSLESPFLSDVPDNIEGTKNLADSHASESPICEQLPNLCGNSVLDCSVGINSFGGDHTLNDTVSASTETDLSSGSKSCNSPDKEADRINSNICNCKETPLESASDHSVRLWTNGGLLGLEPSKPPDFIVSSSLNQGSLTTINEMDNGSNHNSVLKNNGYNEKRDLSAEIAEPKQKEPSSRCLTSSYDDQDCISGKTSDCHQLSNGFGQTDEKILDEIRVPAPGSALPVASDAKACTEPNQGSGENSPPVFGLTHRLLVNRFCRKVSFDEKSGPDNSVKNGILEQSGQNSIVHQSLPETTFKEQVSYVYPVNSPPPSPPLEHMRISFHPISGLETSKLKLKFPDGHHYYESIRDMFPTFHLVPEPSIPLHGSASNSDDDDTFCRSSHVSDDCLIPHSDYNSDQWESGETPDRSDHGLYDSSDRISLTESKLSVQEIREATNVGIDLDSGYSLYTQNSVEPSLSGPLLNFPSFDTVNPVLGQECNKHSDYDNNLKLQSHAEPTQPPPPPLPPKQRQVSKLQLDMMDEMQIYISKDNEQSNDPNISESTLQPRPARVKAKQNDHDGHESYDDISCKLKDKLDQQKLNEQKKANQVKDMDENEDILHQIRTKSFNLRRTVTGEPNATTGPTTNVKVAAILAKAKAIRQVVASDDGNDDDNWSDT